ncbi:MAG TPA: TIGR00730 family Rossman fold protein [Gammaproteobacteria bacterium]|jgi:hypothetical protein|nr:TIGR00730 family Rossman fold protein [Candidatus Hydrogenedentota bacterium]HJP37214.1 TIGR00730 family Rossman fold protein [Gammaproteobacteria bacterium]
MPAFHSICVFCSSSDALDPAYREAAEALGVLLGRLGYRLVFGGGAIGLMGTVARAVHAHGGEVGGVIPRALNQAGVTYEESDELIVTEEMRERKAEMDRLSDAFIALPGGFGTLEEIVEHLTLRQLRYHPKPVVLINTLGYYEPLLRFFEHMIDEGFAESGHLEVFHVAANAEEALAYLETYGHEEPPSRFS